MSIDMPAAVETYFARSNAHDPDALAQAFTADGAVQDEGKLHRGREAIAGWAGETMKKYHMAIQALAVTAVGDSVVVSAKVSGTFPGSPIELIFSFELAEGGIRSLKIGG